MKKNQEKSRKKRKTEKFPGMKSSCDILQVHKNFYREIWLDFEKILKIRKVGKNPEKYKKTDKVPEIKIIIPYLRHKPSIFLRNMIKID